MALNNPYPSKEHRIFKRTFLQQTEVNVKFSPAIASALFRERIVDYAQKHFGVDISAESEPDADSAKIEAVGEQKKYYFGLEFARIIVGPESYDTFADTILPLLPRLQAFLIEVAQIDGMIELNITKRNAWPFKVENAFNDFSDAIGFVFDKKYVEDMCSYKFTENPQPVQLSKMSTEDFGGQIKLDRKIIAEANNNGRIYLELALSTTSQSVKVADISADAVVLNDIIYNNFIEYVSDDIIDLMNND
ncbi:hypothetical protein [uncultured Duncaniella sp.]|uniref:hypothetical protein n=1 Tax=uncultured Duncaniella sp. TaxID=2768039 RepID=UPI0025A94449|nr:hypothetical protein [uncultured Duncaniella sp.]